MRKFSCTVKSTLKSVQSDALVDPIVFYSSNQSTSVIRTHH